MNSIVDKQVYQLVYKYYQIYYQNMSTLFLNLTSATATIHFKCLHNI